MVVARVLSPRGVALPGRGGMSKARTWCRCAGLALPLLASVACGGNERSPNASGGGTGGASGAGGNTTRGSGGGAATGAVGTAWFEVLEPFPAVVEQGTDPSSVMNETLLLGASLDGSVLVGDSSMLVLSGNVQQRELGFVWTRETGVVDLGYPGAVAPDPPYIFPQKVSHDGTVVVGTSGPGLGVPIFRWTRAAGMLDIGKLEGATAVTLDDMSADGAVIVGTSSDQAYRWTAETGMVALGAISGMERSSSLRVSGDGQVVFGTSSSLTESATFRWSAERGMELLEVACRLAPGGVSHDGRTLVGLCTTDEGLLPHQWTEAGGLRSLGVPPVSYSVELRTASAEHGVLIAQGHGKNRDDYQALRASEATGFVALGALPGNPACFVLGGSLDSFPTPRSPMSADGSVVVGSCINTEVGTGLGFRWSVAAGLVALQPLAGHARTKVTSVSPDGIVAGTSSDDAGETEGVLWNAAGEPRSLRALLEAAGVTLDGFTLDDVVVLGGGRLVYGGGNDAAGAGRAWVAMLP